MALEQNERAVLVTVKEAAKQAPRGTYPADYKLTVDSPWFQSQQNTVLFVPLAVGTAVEPGGTLSLVIRSEGVKEKDGQPYDGQKPWMHKWKFVRLADATEVAVAPANGAQPAEKPGALPWEVPSTRDKSIEDQVLLKASIELKIHEPELAPDAAAEWVLAAWDRIQARHELPEPEEQGTEERDDGQ